MPPRNLQPWLARGETKQKKLRFGAGGGARREVLPGSRVWVLLQGFIREDAARSRRCPRNVARAPDVECGVLAGALTAPRSRWIYITIIWRCQSSALGSVWRGREPALRSKHLRNCVVRPLRGSGRCCLRWGFCLSIGCFGRFA